MLIYISRQPAEEFESAFAQKLTKPQESPFVFHVWGIGGVGKTTLTNKLKRDYTTQAYFIEFSFEVTAGIDNVGGSEKITKFIDVLYQQLPNQQLPKPSILKKVLFQSDLFSDPFEKLYQKYWDTIHRLKTQPIGKENTVSKEQLDSVKRLLSGVGSTVAVLNPSSAIAAPLAGKAAEMTVEGISMILTEKDRIRQLLQQHKATKQQRELQELIVEPIPKLTAAFIKSLQQRKRPVVIILDTYEKADLDIDST